MVIKALNFIIVIILAKSQKFLAMIPAIANKFDIENHLVDPFLTIIKTILDSKTDRITKLSIVELSELEKEVNIFDNNLGNSGKRDINLLEIWNSMVNIYVKH